MAKREKKKSADYEYIGTARKDTKLDEEYGTETSINPGTRQIETKTKAKKKC